MNIKKVRFVYFSPALHTKALGKMLAARIVSQSGLPLEEFDLTGAEAASPVFDASSLVILAAPVFGGRIPAPAAKRFVSLVGAGEPLISLVSYGGRAWEDALLELQDIAVASGFQPIGAAACVAAHSIAPRIAADRPDGDDEREIALFAEKVAAMLTRPPQGRGLDIPGRRPYREYNSSPLKRKWGGACLHCGACASHCPTGAIDRNKPENIREELCISCMGCLAVCPAQCHKADPAFVEAVGRKLEAICPARARNEFFMAWE